jgi:deazaflavin-dependent oxidoreductase (nitroreductase family)
MTDDRNEANRKVIEEFRANGGKVGGYFDDKDLLIVHHVGARSGTAYETPLTWFRSTAGDWTVVAANGGRPTDPAWIHNLKAAPEVTIEVPGGSGSVATLQTRARFTEGDERQAILDAAAAESEALRGLMEKTDRVMPIIVFEPVQD